MNPPWFTTRRLGLLTMAVCVLASLSVWQVPVARAANIAVTTLADEVNSDGDCSLREAMEATTTNAAVDACPAGSGSESDTITFGLSGTIVLTATLPAVADPAGLTLDGSGQTITLSGNLAVQILVVTSGAKLTLNVLTITNGFNPNLGGGAVETYGTLHVINSTISHSYAAHGGGIFNDHLATITNSTISDNGAKSIGGGIHNEGTLQVTNSTISGNSADAAGGGIFNRSTLQVANSTISDNSAARSGGIEIEIGDFGDTAMITNSTIVYNNALYAGSGISTFATFPTLDLRNTIIDSSSGTDCWTYDGLTTNINNLIADGSCSPSLSGDPQLGPLATNGGPTLTHAPLPTSPVLNTGDTASCPTTDQRGVARPYPVGGNCDIGAVEAVPGYGSAPAPSSSIAVGTSPIGIPISTTLTISETAELPLDVSSISLSGPHASEFAITPTSLIIPNGAAPQSLTITCTPTAPGLRTATLSVTHTAASSTASYSLTCTGTSVLLGVRKTVDEPQPAPGQRVIYQLVVRNQGEVSTTVSLADALPAPLIVAGPATVEPSMGTTPGRLPLLLENQSLSAGAVLTVTLPVTVPFGLAAGTSLVNTATLTGSGELGSTQSAVAITIRDVPPLARDDLSCTSPQRAISIAVLRNDSDPNGRTLQLTRVATPAHGTASINGASIVYTPNGDFIGVESFFYTVSDGTLEATSSVRLTVLSKAGSCEVFLPVIRR